MHSLCTQYLSLHLIKIQFTQQIHSIQKIFTLTNVAWQRLPRWGIAVEEPIRYEDFSKNMYTNWLCNAYLIFIWFATQAQPTTENAVIFQKPVTSTQNIERESSGAVSNVYLKLQCQI